MKLYWEIFYFEKDYTSDCVFKKNKRFIPFQKIDTISNLIDVSEIQLVLKKELPNGSLDFCLSVNAYAENGTKKGIDRIKKYKEMIEKYKLYDDKNWLEHLNAFNRDNPELACYIQDSVDEDDFDFELLLEQIGCTSTKEFATVLRNIDYLDPVNDQYLVYDTQEGRKNFMIYTTSSLISAINIKQILDYLIEKEESEG